MSVSVDEIRLIPGHERYGVTADGRVWSCVRGGEWREMKQTQSTRGYPKVKLTGGYTIAVHRLVTSVFLGEPQPGMTVDHKDGNKLNAALSNLEYVSQAENNRRAWQDGRQRSGWETRRRTSGGSFGLAGSYRDQPGRRVVRGA